MEFYRALSKYYDEIFPLKDVQKKFLQQYIEKHSVQAILDVGCGTGSFALAAAGMGIKATGVDLSPEMVEIAERRSQGQNAKAYFQVADMLKLDSVLGMYDAVLCLGNTLAHLTTPQDLRQALYQFKVKANRALIQVVNYDRILAKKVTELPEIKTPSLTFHRYYKHLPNLIEFTMQIELREQPGILQAANFLTPLTQDVLKKAIGETGWQDVTWWGSFAGETWNKDSPATIVSLQR